MANNVTASFIGDVEFSRLSAEEIKRISVKRIHVLPTFDDFQQPTAGGLHDPALGPVLDKRCTTCHQNAMHCSGHPGNIELPAPCYHTTFVDHVQRLIRAKCVFCHRLRIPRRPVNLFICKLRLLQYDLPDKVDDLDSMTIGKSSGQNRMTNGASKAHGDGGDSSDSEDDEEAFMKRREKFVRSCIRKAKKLVPQEKCRLKSSIAQTERRTLVKAFLSDIVSVKKCHFCKGFSPGFKKDSKQNILRKPLGKRMRLQNLDNGLKMVNPLVYKQQLERSSQKPEKPLPNGTHESDTEMADGADSEAEELHGAEEEIANTAAAEEEEEASDDGEKLLALSASEVHAAIDLLFRREQELFSLLYSSTPTSSTEPVRADMFFMTQILVPANRYRPVMVEDGALNQSPQNTSLTKILQTSQLVRQIQGEMSGGPINYVRRRGHAELIDSMIQLQKAVSEFVDCPRRPGRDFEYGVKQILEKKEGLFRSNMMGKRVNFAARSVISPDPNIETNEIGVPLVFARKLTYPQPVTAHNFIEMKQAVINGPEKYPGASAIEGENGNILNLKFKSLEDRIAIASQLMTSSTPGSKREGNKKVYRHLQTGDVVLMNRQPTLHKPSMMGHRARVLSNEKTIRMHYTNCNTYNADFDGDEMNMHFLQDEVARTEALQIADTDHQYLSATAGKPLRGLIQDHISMAVQFTSRDTFFNRDDYQQLLYNCLRPEDYHTVYERIHMLPPAILKPRALWTGKQVFSTILTNITPQNRGGINLVSKSATPADRWGEGSEEGEVIFKGGELLCGTLDKAQLGPSANGMIHAVHELYGHIVAGKLLSVIGRLLTRFLNMRGWSCGMEDLYLTVEGDNVRRQNLTKITSIGRATAANFVTLDEKDSDKNIQRRLEDVVRDDEKQADLDKLYNVRTAKLSSDITKACLPSCLWKPFPRNHMQVMTISGAKGSAVNANLISCNLGQQVLEGRRVPVMVSGKTLPSFRPFETDPSAGGYVQGRFLTGIKPYEYYFHAMAGREGLIDTAVKTAKSGYLQRCVVKGLEGLRTEYDYSVREASNGSIIQFLYGEDALDVTKQKHLTQFGFLAQNRLSVTASTGIVDNMERLQQGPEPDAAPNHRKTAIKLVKRTGRVDGMDPVMAVYNPGSHLGSTSEAFQIALGQYMDLNPDRRIKDTKKGITADVMTKKTFQGIMDVKYMNSLVDPGEAVGVVAAQSVGEPSTQMTLNTFHLAGHSAKNVTLGIPRLREIVMTGSPDIKTPSMTLKLIKEMTKEQGVTFAKGLSKLSLGQLVNEAIITESSGSVQRQNSARIYDVIINFFAAAEYLEEYRVSTEVVATCLKDKFLPRLTKMIKAEFKKKARESSLAETTAAVPKVGKSVGHVTQVGGGTDANDGGRDDDDDLDDDVDPDDAKQARQRQDDDYDDPDEDEGDLATSDPELSSEDEEETDADGARSKVPSKGGETSDQASHTNSDDDDDEDDAEANDAEEIISANQHLTKYKFSRVEGKTCEFTLAYDSSTSKILLLPIVEKCLHQTIIQEISGIGTCTFTEEKRKDSTTGEERDEFSIITSGVNINAFGDYQDVIHPHSIYTNSIHHMLNFYGVEAARNTVIREIDDVFKGHSISVDNRHLNLIGDAMTQNGGYQAFSRHGLVRSNGSALAKMSFETVIGFLKEAVLDGGSDPLTGPSANIAVGRRGNVGTGSFDVIAAVGGGVVSI